MWDLFLVLAAMTAALLLAVIVVRLLGFNPNETTPHWPQVLAAVSGLMIAVAISCLFQAILEFWFGFF